MMQPRVFVGTLECGEGDFEECVKAINRQKNATINHVIIRGRPEKEAHNELFETWTAVKDSFDFFVKVDADTVLAHPFVFEFIDKMFKSNERFTSIQVPLSDYFTNSMINGLNAYVPRVVFKPSPELYCDRVDTGHDIQVFAKDVVRELFPAGFHCFNATPRQAFHFGLHRMLKGQHDIINRVRQAHQQHPTQGILDTREFVLAGAEVARECQGQHNYADTKFEELFNREYERINNTP